MRVKGKCKMTHVSTWVTTDCCCRESWVGGLVGIRTGQSGGFVGYRDGVVLALALVQWEAEEAEKQLFRGLPRLPACVASRVLTEFSLGPEEVGRTQLLESGRVMTQEKGYKHALCPLHPSFSQERRLL